MSLTQVTSTMLSGVPIQVSTNGVITTINANNTPVITSNGATTNISNTLFTYSNSEVGRVDNGGIRLGTTQQKGVITARGDIVSIDANNNSNSITFYAGTYGGGAYLQSYDPQNLNGGSNWAPLSFYAGNNEKARFDVSGNFVFRQNNTGIVFQNSSAATNSTLNDYETGSWTPTLSFGGVNHDGTYGYQAAKYTKIGNVVTVGGIVGINSTGTTTGAARLANLPFTGVAISGGSSVVLGLYGGMTSLAGTCIFGDGPSSATYVTLYTGTSSTYSAMNRSNFTTTGNYVEFYFSYIANF